MELKMNENSVIIMIQIRNDGEFDDVIHLVNQLMRYDHLVVLVMKDRGLKLYHDEIIYVLYDHLVTFCMMRVKRNGHGSVSEKIDEMVLLEMVEVNEMNLFNCQSQLIIL
jgi:hypothetical protein